VPVCPGCGGHLRPGVVWFGEAIPEQALQDSFAAATDCDVFLSIGTSSLVYPAAGLAEMAKNTGAVVAEVNPDPTGQAAGFDHAIAAKAGTVMPEILNRLTTP
jgi:NAD-dependent deacetylase